jgi:hypothetical protein
VVLILDVCHSGVAATTDAASTSGGPGSDLQAKTGGKGLSRTRNFDVDTVSPGGGQAILCSSLADQISWESKQYQNSVFTRRLINALKMESAATKPTHVYERLRKEVELEVLSDRGEVQTPVLNMKSWRGGDPALAARPATNPGLAPASGNTAPRKLRAKHAQ